MADRTLPRFVVRGQGPPALLLHGFTQSLEFWDELTGPLGRLRTLVMPDLPGHGPNPLANESDCSIETTIDRLLGLMDHLDIGEFDLCGYSLGGRLALHLALAAAARVRSLCLISTSAGIDDPGQRLSRRRADRQLAIHVTEVGVQQFLREWMALPLFAGLRDRGQARLDRELAVRSRCPAESLAASLRQVGQGELTPVWNRLEELGSPVLLLVGDNDPKYRELAVRMRLALPSARLAIIPNSGHVVPLEQPSACADAITRFWSAHRQVGRQR